MATKLPPIVDPRLMDTGLDFLPERKRMGYTQTDPSRLPPGRGPVVWGDTFTDPSRLPQRPLPVGLPVEPDLGPGIPGFTGGSDDFDENTGTYRSTGTPYPPGVTPPVGPPKSGLVKNVKTPILTRRPGPTTPAPTPGTPGPITPERFPGVPQAYLDMLSYGPNGQLLLGGEQPVKFEGGRLVADVKPQTFGWEKYATPVGDGFTGVRNGQNFVNGHLFAAEGLNQGDASNPLGTGFGNWLRAHGERIGGSAAEYVRGLGGTRPLPEGLPVEPESGNPITRPAVPNMPVAGPGTGTKPSVGTKPGAVVATKPAPGGNFSQINAGRPNSAQVGSTDGTARTGAGATVQSILNNAVGTRPAPSATPGVSPDGRGNFWQINAGRQNTQEVGLQPVTTALNPVLNAYANSGRDANDPVFTQTAGAVPGAEMPGTTFGTATPAPRSGAASTVQAIINNAGDNIKPPAASKTPVGTSGLGRSAPPYYEPPRTATFADGGRASKRRRRPVTLEHGLEPMKPADFGPLPPNIAPSYGPGMRPAEFGPLAPQFDIGKPRSPADFGPLPPGRKPAWLPGMPMPELVGYGGDKPFDPWARSRAMARTSMADFGLEPATLTRMQPRVPFTNGYADGGRVERGYADGGEVSEEEWRRRNAQIIAAEDAIARARGGGTLPFDPRYMEYLPNYGEGGGDIAQLRPEFAQGGLADDDPLVQRFLAQYGQRDFLDENGKPIILDDGGSRYFVGHRNPYADLMQDPNRVLRLPDGRMVWDRQNVQSWEMDDRQRAEETSDRRSRQQYLRTIAMMAAPWAASYLFPGAFAGMEGAGQMGAAMGEGFGTSTGMAGIGLEAAGTAGVGVGATGNATVDMSALAASPAVQGAAASAGQSVTQWLSNPANLLRAARIAGTVISAVSGGGNRSSGQVQPIPGPGDTIPGGAPGVGTPVPAPGPTPVPQNTAQLTAPPTEQPLDPAFLESLDPANFQGGPADLRNWQETRGRFRPLEDMLFGEAMAAGSAAEQEAAAGTAGADVEQTFRQAINQQRDRLIAQGINPDAGSGPGTELARLAMLDKAKAAAGAKNIARRGEKERGFAARAQAAGIGNAIAGQALNADNIGLQYDVNNRRMALDAAGRRADIGFRAHEGAADRRMRTWDSSQDREFRRGEGEADRTFRGTQADTYRSWRSGESAADRELRRQQINADIAAGNYNRNRQDAQDRGTGIGNAIGWARDAYGLYRDWSGGDSGSVSDAYDLYGGASSGNWGDIFGLADGGRVSMSDVGLGTDAPKKKRRDYRDGARVEGAGTSTSDSIRARLSDGEGVINAEAMELLDATEPGKLEELNEQGLKIRAVRKALKRGMADFGLEA